MHIDAQARRALHNLSDRLAGLQDHAPSVHPHVIHDLGDRHLKANPEKLTLGTAGFGSGQHVSGIYFQSVIGTTLRFVPYRAGSSDIMKDLVGGHIDMTFDQAISALPYVRNGQIKAYAITANARLAAAPDIPAVDEACARGVYISAPGRSHP